LALLYLTKNDWLTPSPSATVAGDQRENRYGQVLALHCASN